MTKPAHHLGRIFGIRLRAATAALALAAFALASTVLVAQSEREPSYSYKVLYDFCSLENCTDGAVPMAGLIQDARGNLYGTSTGSNAEPAVSY